MAKEIKLSVTLPDGQIATRTTARAYTHVVIGQRDVALERSQAMSLRADLDADNHAFYRKEVAAGQRDTNTSEETWAAWTQYAAMTVGEYRTFEVERRLAKIKDEYGTVDVGAWTCLQWSGSEKNASEALGSFRKRGWINVQVLAI
uniref:Uncharacterized protein n=1 Tax=Pseudomonas phage Cygsa01 TaxID=3138529 RepID=A0AAU6W3L2_9VIRU